MRPRFTPILYHRRWTCMQSQLAGGTVYVHSVIRGALPVCVLQYSMQPKRHVRQGACTTVPLHAAIYGWRPNTIGLQFAVGKTKARTKQLEVV